MKFVVLYTQAGEGCDYMINCGVNYELVEGESIEEVKTKILYPDGLDEHCILDFESTDISYDSIIVIPYEEAIHLDLDLEKNRINEEKNALKEITQLAADEMEFERLKKLLKK